MRLFLKASSILGHDYTPQCGKEQGEKLVHISHTSRPCSIVVNNQSCFAGVFFWILGYSTPEFGTFGTLRESKLFEHEREIDLENEIWSRKRCSGVQPPNQSYSLSVIQCEFLVKKRCSLLFCYQRKIIKHNLLPTLLQKRVCKSDAHQSTAQSIHSLETVVISPAPKQAQNAYSRIKHS